MSGRHLFKGSFSPDAVNLDKDVVLTGIVWKRRSGFAQFSDSIIGAGTSWEKRRITLHHDRASKTSAARLCYYAVDGADRKTPRGTVYLKSERAVVWANHHPSDGSQPTPYSLSVLPDGGTKWKFCFEDRKTQMAWLVALTDVIVEESVREFNANILLRESSNWDHGGFHRLYEEGTPGLFQSVRESLLGSKAEIVGLVLENSERDLRTAIRNSSTTEGIEVVGVRSERQSAKMFTEGNCSPVNKTLTESATQTLGPQTISPTGDIMAFVISSQKIYQSLSIANLSVIYVYLTGQSSSFIAIPWWQLLLAMNAIIFYVCMTPKRDNKDEGRGIKIIEDSVSGISSRAILEEKPSARIHSNGTSFNEDTEDEAPVQEVTKSAVGKALLRSEDVPLSDIPTDLHPKHRLDRVSEHPPPRTEQLTEDEMSAHLHERWAMSAPDCDLSGSWTLIADDAFKAEYDTYLKQLGFNRITRGVACSLIARTTEITKQSKCGRELYLKGVNPKGAWERVLIASGYPDFETSAERKEGKDYNHMKTSIKTADSEDVNAEAWWEKRGTGHRSWLKGGTKYGGGDFESLRYLEEGSGGNVLVCESTFHPKDVFKKRAVVKWRFQRDAQ